MGVFAANRIAVVAQSMANLGVRHAFVVFGLDGLDELTITGETMVAEVRNRPTADWDKGIEESGRRAPLSPSPATGRT